MPSVPHRHDPMRAQSERMVGVHRQAAIVRGRAILGLNAEDPPYVPLERAVQYGLISLPDMAEVYGYSKSTIHKWITRPDFPKPIAYWRQSTAMLWAVEDVAHWYERVGSRRFKPSV